MTYTRSRAAHSPKARWVLEPMGTIDAKSHRRLVGDKICERKSECWLKTCENTNCFVFFLICEAKQMDAMAHMIFIYRYCRESFRIHDGESWDGLSLTGSTNTRRLGDGVPRSV